jgi:hypothetical protein
MGLKDISSVNIVGVLKQLLGNAESKRKKVKEV